MPRPERSERGGRGGKLKKRRKKACRFCVDRTAWVIDYKNVPMLREFIDERARIKKARQTGTCRKHQRKLSWAIKRSREIALLPYTLD